MGMLPNSEVIEKTPGPSSTFTSDRQQGIAVDELPVGAVLEVETGHHTYRVENRGEGKILISGHPEYCPEPVLVDLHGSLADGPIFKMWFIGRGLKMEFRHPKFGIVHTSRVREVRELNPAPSFREN